ncbi:MAG: hypothetical protein L6Q37_04585, partial [Bdellovibrionaceae bacterium]|nr:hypothetical protein [Pseudobdellovibrionaceae bacterium]
MNLFVLLFTWILCGCTSQFDSQPTSNAGSGNFSLAENSTTIIINSQYTVTPTGGTAPFYYSIESSSVSASASGSIRSDGVYTAPSQGNITVIIKITDSLGGTSKCFISVNDELSVTYDTQYALAGSSNKSILRARGGLPPYTWDIVSGYGVISQNGLFTPPATPGTTVIRLTDSRGVIRDLPIIVNPSLTIYPGSGDRFLAINSSLSLSASGGVPPYIYSLVSGPGMVIGNVLYGPTRGSAGSTVTVRVTDFFGNTSNGDFTIVNPSPLSLSPASRTIATLPVGISPTSALYTYTASGGSPPYIYSVISGPGSIDTATGGYTPPQDGLLTQRTAVVRVTDANLSTRDSIIMINPLLQASPSSLVISAGTQNRIDGLGGLCPYSFLMLSGNGILTTTSSTNSNFSQGVVSCNAGLFVAPNTAGSAVIRIIDAVSSYVDINVTVTGTSTGGDQSTLTISPVSRVTSARNSSQIFPTASNYTYSTSGGVTPYVYSIVSGVGTVGAQTGVFVPPADNSSLLRTTIVRVTDQAGSYRDSTVMVNPALSVVTTPVSNYIPSTIGFGLIPQLTLPSVSQNRTIATLSTIRLDGKGGIAPYTYSLYSGTGSLYSVSSSGNNYAQSSTVLNYALFTAPASSGTSIIRIVDAVGNVVDSTITVVDTQLGALDSSFASTGKVIISFDISDSLASSIVQSSDAGLIIGGSSINSGTGYYEMALAKLTPSGSLDSSFGGLGLPSGSGKSRWTIPGCTQVYLNSMALQSDGKIVVAGTCLNASSGNDFLIVRILANGSALDTTFNSTGYATIQVTAGAYNETINSIAINTSDGSIIAGGTCYSTTSTTQDFCFARFTSAGALDTTFNTTGKLIVNISSTHESLGSMILNTNGSIYYSGSTSTNFIVGKLTSAGSSDTSFGYNGTGRVTYVGAQVGAIINNTSFL